MPRLKEWEVVVAGAGPAGAVLASSLARGGARVLLVDPLPRLRHKIGESLPGAALPLLRSLGLPLPTDGGPHRRIRGNSSAWGAAELHFTDFIFEPDGPGWRLNRLEFDAGLRAAAVAAGSMLARTGIEAVTRVGGYWRIVLGTGEVVRARWLVDATGRRAAVARKLRVSRRRDDALVAVYALSRRGGKTSTDRTLVETVPEGWWYAAWLPTGAAIAALHLNPADAARMKAEPECWHCAFARTRHVTAMLAGARFVARLHTADAAGACLAQFAGDGWLACGDAAMSFDPVSAQGIYFAIYSADLAARAILQSRGAPRVGDYSSRLTAYREAYVSRLGDVYRSESRWAQEPFWRQRQSSEL